MFTIEIRGRKNLHLEVTKESYIAALTYAKSEGKGYERTIEGILHRQHDAHYETPDYNLWFWSLERLK